MNFVVPLLCTIYEKKKSVLKKKFASTRSVQQLTRIAVTGAMHFAEKMEKCGLPLTREILYLSSVFTSSEQAMHT